MRATPEAVHAALGTLPLTVEDAGAVVAAALVPSYPGGPRPHSIVHLAGAGQVGAGEHVGWTDAAHVACRDRALPRLPRGRWRLADWCAAVQALVAEDYDRAAVEAAAIDLALRQAGTTLFGLAARRPEPVRYVVSFGRVADPAAEARRHGDVELKVDADPAWSDTTLGALAGRARVAVLDWKGTGCRADHERAHRALPGAWIEDPCWSEAPWSAEVQVRLSADAPVRRAADVARLPVRPAGVNLKPGRMGGVFEVLAAATACEALGIAVYLGGMFEIDVGRRQLQTLAALLSPDGPNDVAPIPRDEAPIDRPVRLVVPVHAAGFGA